MKNLVASTVTAAALLAGASASAQATDNWSAKTNAIGVGVDRLVTGGTGISLRMFPTELVGLELGFGTTINSLRDVNNEADTDVRRSTRNIGLHLLGEFRMVSSNQATLAAFAGFGFATNSASTTIDKTKEVDGYNDIAIELGFRGEVFLARFFSVFGRVGLTLDPVNDGEREFGSDGDNDTQSSGMNVELLRGDLLGAFGFTFWIPFSASR